MIFTSYTLRQIYASTSFMLFFFSFGFFQSILSIMLPELKRTEYIKLTMDQESWIASINFLSMFPSSVIAGLLTDKYGRKYIFIPYVFLPFVTSFVIYYFAKSFAALVTASAIAGLFGGGMSLGHLIVSECTAPKYRGTMMNTKNIATAIGITIPHILGNYYSYRTMVLYGTIAPCIAVITTLTSPESPAWLAGQGRFEECTKAFNWLRGDGGRDELNELILCQKRMLAKHQRTDQKGGSFKTILRKLTDRVFIKCQAITFFGLLLFDASGKQVFSIYAIDLLNSMTKNTVNPYLSVLVFDLTDIISAVICCLIFDKFKRKTLLIGGGGIGAIVLVIFCSFGLMQAKSVLLADYMWLSLIPLIIYFMIMQTAVIPTGFIIISEVVPLEFRGLSYTVSSIEFVCLLFACVKITPLLILNLSVYGTFMVFLAIGLVSLTYLYYAVPETKGRTMQDIENEMRGIKMPIVVNNADEVMLESNDSNCDQSFKNYS